MSLLRRFFRWLPAILMMAVIFGFSSIPSREMPRFGMWDLLVKKGSHAFGYGLLALSYHYALSPFHFFKRPLASCFRSCSLAWTLAVLYSATDEFHQSFIPGRHAAARDVLIDAAGAALALYFGVWFSRRKCSRAKINE